MSPREQVEAIRLLREWMYYCTDASACQCPRCLASLQERTQSFLNFFAAHGIDAPESHGDRRGL